MKHLVSVFLFVLLLGVNSNAQALFSETFDYTDGALMTIVGLNAGSTYNASATASNNVCGGAWTAGSTSAFDDPLMVETGALTYSGYSLSGVGKKLFCTNLPANTSNNRGYRNFSSTQTGKVYYSMMVKIQTLTGMGSGQYIIALNQASSTTSANLRGLLYFGNGSIAGTNFKIGVAATTSSITYSTTDRDPANTYLVVVCYDRTVSQAKLWINPDLSGSEPTPDVTTTAGSADALATVGDIVIYQKAVYPKIYLGGIKVATTWAEAPLPVELTSFTAKAKNNVVELVWNTATETNNYGFEVEKKKMKDELGNMNWEKIGFVEGNGTSNSPHSYSYLDARLNGIVVQGSASGKMQYRLKQIDRDGKFTYSNSVEATVVVSEAYALVQNYPNPFNPATIINYQLSINSFTTLKIFDIVGREVATLINEMKNAGNHSIQFDASHLPTGVYFYQIKAGNFIQSKKMLLTK